jgi:hypothetical protein
MDPDNRGNVAALIRELADVMNAFRESGRRPDYVPPPLDIEAELAAKYRDKPLPQLSAELRAKLGISKTEVAAK